MKRLTVGDLREAMAHLPPTQHVLVNGDYYAVDTHDDCDPDGFFVIEPGERL